MRRKIKSYVGQRKNKGLNTDPGCSKLGAIHFNKRGGPSGKRKMQDLFLFGEEVRLLANKSCRLRDGGQER